MLGACGPARAPAPVVRSAAPHTPSAIAPPKLDEASYWEDVPVTITGPAHPVTLPLSDSAMTAIEAADGRFRGLPESLRSELRTHGMAVGKSGAATDVGAFYKHLRDEQTAALVTVDALLAMLHVALDAALGELETKVTRPALVELLPRLDSKLAAEAKGARAELAEPYRLAQGLVAVARALLDRSYVAPPELAAVVAAELTKIGAHEGAAPSPLVDVPINYAMFAAAGGVEHGTEAHAAQRCATWLAAAPLVLLGRTEQGGGALSVGDARTHARAALLLARVTDESIDPETARRFKLLETVARMTAGPPADVTLSVLRKRIFAAGWDMHEPAFVENVVKVDRVRRMAHGGPSHIDDSGAQHGAATVRLLPARACRDAELLQALVFPFVGAPGAAAEPRRLPSGLDVAAWLGSTQALAELHASGADALRGYPEALERFVAARKKEGVRERHRSFYASGIEAASAILGDTLGGRSQPYAASAPWARLRLERGLVAWTLLRHAGIPFTHGSVAPIPQTTPATSRSPVFVEPAPEAIAAMLGLVRQLKRGVRATGGGATSVPPVLGDVEAILAATLRLALHVANDEPWGDAEQTEASAIVARLEAIDAHATAEAAVAVTVHVDIGQGKFLVEATGDVGELHAIFREPGSGALRHVVGARVSHHEFVEPAPLGDDAWHERLRAKREPRPTGG